MNELATLNQAPKGALIEKLQLQEKKLSRFQAGVKKAKEHATRVADQFLVTGVALGSSFGYGYLVSKNPSWAQLGSTGIDTDLAVGASALLGGLVIGDAPGRYLSAMGVGLLAPWARDMGASLAAPAAAE